MVFAGRCGICGETAVLSNTELRLKEASCAHCEEDRMQGRDELMGGFGFLITTRGA